MATCLWHDRPVIAFRLIINSISSTEQHGYQRPHKFWVSFTNGYHRTLRAENTFLQEGETQPLPHLTHLYIDCPDDFFAFRLIYKLRPASLIDLSVSALSKEPDPIHVYAFETVLPKLHNLTILNISRNVGFIQKFFAPDRRLQHYKHGLQLYRTPLTQKPPPNYPPRIWPPIYLLTEIIFGKLIESIPKSLVHPFGDQVRHICISNKGMGSIQVDGIDDPVYALTNLRVLIIRPPVVVGRGYWDPTLEIKPYPQGRLSLPLPHPTESYPAVKGDAMFLARQQLLSLRFVVLHNQYFWIEHLDGQRHKTQVWVRISGTKFHLKCASVRVTKFFL